MSHVITQIVDQVRTRLAAAGTYAGSNVEADRDWPIAPPDGVAFDWLLVTAGADRVVDSTPMRPRRITAELEVKVRTVCRVSSVDGNAAARARALMLQAQLALLGPAADIRLGGIAKFMRYAGSEPIEDELNLDVAARDVSFIVTFQTSEASFEAST